jgi:hypothetical protein
VFDFILPKHFVILYNAMGASHLRVTMKAFTWQEEHKPEKYVGYENWRRGHYSKLTFRIKVDIL